jgi:uncharacterized protein YerC
MMPRTCTICIHPARAAIDKALVDGQPYRYIAQHFGTSVAALQRHNDDVPVGKNDVMRVNMAVVSLLL